MTDPIPVDLPEPLPPEQRLADIRAAKAERARIRAAFAERRRYGVAARHRAKLRRNRQHPNNKEADQ